MMKRSEEEDFSKYTMYLKTVQAAAIRTLSEALKEVINDVNIHFDKSGFHINALDTKQVSFIHLKLDSDKFETFHCERPFHIGVNMKSLHIILKTINNSDIINLYIEKDNDQFLCIDIKNQDKKCLSSSKMRLKDLDDLQIKIPKITFDCVYNMPCSDFQKYCRDLLQFSQTVKIYSNRDIFILNVVGDFAQNSIQIGSSEQTNDVEFIGEYDLKFINLFCKASGLCPTLEIYLKKDIPLILSYSVAALGTIKFGLSPSAHIQEQ